MSNARTREEKLAWAHDRLAWYLDTIARDFPSFPRLTVIVRDPDKPERHIVLTNEPAEITDAIEAIVRVPEQLPVLDPSTLLQQGEASNG